MNEWSVSIAEYGAVSLSRTLSPSLPLDSPIFGFAYLCLVLYTLCMSVSVCLYLCMHLCSNEVIYVKIHESCLTRKCETLLKKIWDTNKCEILFWERHHSWDTTRVIDKKMWDTRKCETLVKIMGDARKCETHENVRHKKMWDTRKYERLVRETRVVRGESWLVRNKLSSETSREMWVILQSCLWVMPRMWMSRVTHVNESCHACKWVVSHLWMSRVTHVNESCHTCESVVSHMWMSRVTHVHESWHTCGWVVSHMWIATAES